MSDGLACLCGLIGIFNKYAGKDADKDHLNKSELKDLLLKEFPGILSEKDSCDPKKVQQIMSDLDHDGDGQVDIQEYFITICALGLCLNDCIKKEHGSKKC